MSSIFIATIIVAVVIVINNKKSQKTSNNKSVRTQPTSNNNTEKNYYNYVDYRELLRLESKDLGEKIQFFGTITNIEKEELIEISNEEYYYTILWIEMMDNDTYKNVYVKYFRNIKDTKLLEKDFIKIEGTYDGNEYQQISEYDKETGTMEMYVFPRIWADKIEIIR